MHHLLATDDSARFALDDHVFRGSKEQAGRGEVPRLIEILHDVGRLLGLELPPHTHKQNHPRNVSATMQKIKKNI